ncbi:hypothetical protein Tco_1143115 [Tanacetum coccineum]
MFDESLNSQPYGDLQAPEVIAPIPEVVAPEHAVLTGSPSSTTVDQECKPSTTKKLFMGEQAPPPRSVKICFESCDPVDTPIVGKKSKLYEDKGREAVDLSHIVDSAYLKALKCAFAYADHAGCQDTRHKNICSKQLLVKDFNQLADIFTKALGRERIEFLINKLGMRSFTPETLKKLADDTDE